MPETFIFVLIFKIMFNIVKYYWLSEEAMVSYRTLFSSHSNTSHLYFPPSEMFPHPLFHVGRWGEARLREGEGRRRETQALLAVWKDRPDLLTPAPQAILSSPCFPPPPIVRYHISIHLGSLHSKPHQVTASATAPGTAPNPNPEPPLGVPALKGREI